MERPISFRIEAELPGTLARAGELVTPHGTLKTPAFIAVATMATVKAIQTSQFKELGIQCVIANAYHLYLSPGENTVAHAGGVSDFMGWHGPTMTDSGGFQILSLGGGMGKKILPSAPSAPEEEGIVRFDEEAASQHGKFAVVDDEGVSFTSHLNGSLHRFTPERSIEIQQALGADIIFAFDECTASSANREYQRIALDRTHRWARRSLAAHRRNVEKNAAQAIYGIVQGGRFADLRVESARTLADMDFDGYGIGGSFNKDDILKTLEIVDRELPKEKPRHLLGIGEPEDIFLGVAAGIDSFDCVLPTRNGRNGTIYTHTGKTIIARAEYAEDLRPLDPDCDCFVCKTYTRSYVHHLFRTHEMLAGVLASSHNMRFLTRLTEHIRQSVIDRTFDEYRDTFLAKYIT